MAVSKGTQTQLILYEETVYGQPPAPPKGTQLNFLTYAAPSSRELLQPNTITSSRQRSRPAQDVVDVSGPLTYELAAEDIGILLKHLLGSVDTQGADPFTHTFTPSDLPVGLRCELDNGAVLSGANQFSSAAGIKIASADFSFPTTGFATATFNLVGQDVTYSAGALDASPLLISHNSLPMSVATIEEDGVVIGYAADISLTINNNIETDVRGISPGGLRIDAPEGFVDVSGSLTSLLVDDSLLAKADAGTPSDLKITLNIAGDGSPGDGFIEFFVGKLIYSRTSPIVEGPGSRRLNFDFSGYKDGVTDSIQVIVKNSLPNIVKP